MTQVSFRLDRAGVREILKSQEVREVIDQYAGEIATNVAALVPGTSIQVYSYTTDRASASVVVEDVRAMGWQARDGILTRAAAFAGLEVKAWQR